MASLITIEGSLQRSAISIEIGTAMPILTKVRDNVWSLPPLHPNETLLSDSNEDVNWVVKFANFSSIAAHIPFPKGSFMEDPLAKLSMYNLDEDLSTWTFKEIYDNTSDNTQWQELELTLLYGQRRFAGSLPSVHQLGSGSVESAVDYFLCFWPSEALTHICTETNRCPIIKSCMARQHFEAITRCVHLVDNRDLLALGQSNHNKMGKVRWLVEHFSSILKAQYNYEVNVTIDKIMVSYKGRYCNIRQYMKVKPVQFRIKVWTLASSQARYVSNLIVYLGLGDVREELDLVGVDAILQVVRGLEGKGHVIITGNFFTSVSLFTTLLARLLVRGFYATGTVKKVSHGFPPSLVRFPKLHQPPRGTLAVKMHQSRAIVVIAWVDSKPV